MSSQISKRFALLKKSKQKAFIAYITAGFPDLKTTEKAIHLLARSGVDVIEVGMPFSDPMADGPTIQRANEIAIKRGTTAKKILRLVKNLRRKIQTPIVLMGYYNPIYQYGLKKFAHDCENCGVDGLLIVDLPPEEAKPLCRELKGTAIDLIHLVTPTTDLKRIAVIKKSCSGYVYAVSYTGITGTKGLRIDEVKKNMTFLKKHLSLPIVIGFGIATPTQVKQLAPLADGVVVGSALVKELGKKGGRKRLETLLRRLKSPLKLP